MNNFVKITVMGQEALFAALSSLDARASEVVARVAPKLYEVHARHVTEQFNAEGGRAGQHWTLSEAYAKRKAKTHPGKPVMQREGLLLASLTNRDSDGAIYDVRPDSITFGSSLPYAAVQGKTHDLFGEREGDADEYLEIIADDLTSYARDLGFKT